MNAGRLAAAAVALTIVVAAVVFLLGDGWPSLGPSHAGAPIVTPAPTPAPTTRVDCRAEAGPLPTYLASDPCPAAVLAVELAVAPVRLPIERIVIEPGPFYCDVLWPGRQTPVVCFGFSVQPGQYMHAWATFAGTLKVAAVMLGLDLPSVVGPNATRPPWNATLVALEIPPDGWVMP